MTALRPDQLSPAGSVRGRRVFHALDDLPSSQFAETIGERLFYEDRVRVLWRCRVTGANFSLDVADSINVPAGYVAFAWAHLFHARIAEFHAALLRLREDVGEEVARRELELIGTRVSERCRRRAVDIAARSRTDQQLESEVEAHMRSREDRLVPDRRLPEGWEQIASSRDFRRWLAGQPRHIAELAYSPLEADAARLIDLYTQSNSATAVRAGVAQSERTAMGIVALERISREVFRTAELERQAALAELYRNVLDNMNMGIVRPQALTQFSAVDPGLLDAMRAPPPRQMHDHAAVARARDTLVACLNPAQLEQFNATGEFDVVMSRPQGWPRGRYRIRQRRTFMVRHVETGDDYCAVLDDPSCPIYDQMLAMKLLLEIEPARFFATANRSRVGGPEILMSLSEATARFAQILPWRNEERP